MPRTNGAVLWQGASLIDGAPIVAIVTGLANASSNRKTGAMLQTYILRADLEPTQAVRSGADASICGSCTHRGVQGPDGMEKRTCYVNVGQGPLSVWRAWKRGVYADYSQLGRFRAVLGNDRKVRLGTYGDPAAVPVETWIALVLHSSGHTGYTHQWRAFPALRTLCMASVDSAAEAAEAQALGWRTFRVAMPRDSARDLTTLHESICPASAEAGKKLTCAECLACGGADGRRGGIVIQAHGGFAVMTHVNRAGVRPFFARSE